MLTNQIDAIFSQQAGLASVQQLVAAGMTRSAIRSRLERHWRFVLPRVVAESRRPLDEGQRRVAALLLAGEGSVLGSLTAAGWHGVRSAARDRRVHVDVPVERRVRAQGFVVLKRTSRPDPQPTRVPPLWIASAPRAVADAARDCGGDAARAIVIEAVQRRLVTTAELRHQLELGPRQGSTALREAIGDAELGAWSIPEVELARIAAGSSVLPPMTANPVLTVGDGVRLPCPDGWFDDVGLAVQVHSKRYHAGDLDWEATVYADGVFAEHGIPVVAITPRQITTQPTAVLARLERAYDQARRRPRPAVTMTARASSW